MRIHDLVVCLSNEGFMASLEPRKIYRVIRDEAAAREEMIRVLDESDEDYLYPASLFEPIELPESTRRALHLAA